MSDWFSAISGIVAVGALILGIYLGRALEREDAEKIKKAMRWQDDKGEPKG